MRIYVHVAFVPSTWRPRGVHVAFSMPDTTGAPLMPNREDMALSPPIVVNHRAQVADSAIEPKLYRMRGAEGDHFRLKFYELHLHSFASQKHTSLTPRLTPSFIKKSPQ